MHADELRQAVTKIVDLLRQSEIGAVLNRYRAAKGDERTVAAARLGHAGAMIMDRMQALSPAERGVARLMHLDELGTTEYWEGLLDGTSDARAHQGDIVRLASRVMFATGQLPAMISLLEPVQAQAPPTRAALGKGERHLVIRLADAGERASDPDRIARSIDGVDMLYSACASIARKPAMDLRMDGIEGVTHRDIRFTGERDGLSAVISVIESIPAALADIDPEGDIDLERVVESLPVFDDLDKLGSLGTFPSRELKDISETMHQGALLVLESGVILVDEPIMAGGPDFVGSQNAGGSAAAMRANASAAGATHGNAEQGSSERNTDARTDSGHAASPAGADEGDADEHYERYLREREAMQRPATNGAVDSNAETRRDAVEELLRSLDQSRNGG